ncbi:MAG: hypothetical protein KF775_19580 [Cyclobacteriaceae bacterium]|nr:hypothetical protein [Cyclobacteriaceae bacterium]
MKSILTSLLLISAISMSAIAQNSKDEKPSVKSDRPDGLVKIAGPTQDWNFDIHIDGKALEQTIESALRLALRSVEHSLEAIQIHLEPIELNLRGLNSVTPIEIRIPEIKVEVEPIEVELGDLDMDFDFDFDFDLDNDSNDEWKAERGREKELQKAELKDSKAERKEIVKETEAKDQLKSQKEKAKGLKKIN